MADPKYRYRYIQRTIAFKKDRPQEMEMLRRIDIEAKRNRRSASEQLKFWLEKIMSQQEISLDRNPNNG